MDPGSEAAASSNHGMVLLYREQNRVERHGRKRAERKKGRGGERSGAAGTRGEVLGGSPGWRRASAGGALVGWIDGLGNEEIPRWETTKVECGGGDGWDISLDFRVCLVI